MKGKIGLPPKIQHCSEITISAEPFGEDSVSSKITRRAEIVVEADIRSDGKSFEPLVETFPVTPASLKELNALFKYVSEHIQDAQYNAIAKVFQRGRFFALRSHEARNPRAHKKLILDWIDLIQSIEKQAIIESLNLKVGRGGSVGKWTPETRAEFLKLYNQILSQVKDAKRAYKDNQKRRNWPEIVKAAHPDLPDSVIKRLNLQGIKPSDTALELSAIQFGVHGSEYLKRVLKEARREAEKARDIE
ncbi:MAG: hypothetical protein JOZ02_24065 [Acidobacteria bacterium]|nr:hypothetical protein [Acidobacteriota bacterium]